MRKVAPFLLVVMLLGIAKPARADELWKWLLGGVVVYGLTKALNHDDEPRQVETDAINGVAAITPVEIDPSGRMVATTIKRQVLENVVDDVVYDTAFPVDKGAVVVGVVNVASGRSEARLVRVRLDGVEWLTAVASPPPRTDQFDYLQSLISPVEFGLGSQQTNIPSRNRRWQEKVGPFPLFTNSPPYFFAFSTKYMAPNLPHMVELVFETTGKYQRTVSITLRFYVVETRMTTVEIPNPAAYPGFYQDLAPQWGLPSTPPPTPQPPLPQPSQYSPTWQGATGGMEPSSSIPPAVFPPVPPVTPSIQLGETGVSWHRFTQQILPPRTEGERGLVEVSLQFEGNPWLEKTKIRIFNLADPTSFSVTKEAEGGLLRIQLPWLPMDIGIQVGSETVRLKATESTNHIVVWFVRYLQEVNGNAGVMATSL